MGERDEIGERGRDDAIGQLAVATIKRVGVLIWGQYAGVRSTLVQGGDPRRGIHIHDLGRLGHEKGSWG
jgi:hypothetical protein